MSLASIKTAAIAGCSALPVTVEVILKGGGLPKFTIIGLADSAIKESKDRVISALQQSGFKLPEKILVSLSPAELRKEGSSFDLPIAVGILVALQRKYNQRCLEISFHGELGLDGSLKGVRGALLYALAACKYGIPLIGIPIVNAEEASIVKDVSVLGFSHIIDIIEWLSGSEVSPTINSKKRHKSLIGSLDDIIGQEKAKRAATIAASGGHNLLFVGPPGCGKSMLSSRIPSILPVLSDDEQLVSGMIHSAYGLRIDDILSGCRPFRAPHYTISDVALVGGGSNIKPGEISLAHNGILFLDEFPEFRRQTVESLRTPMEAGEVHIARAKGSVTLPAKFQLIAAMNPCPCGRLGCDENRCVCSVVQIQKYLKQLSQPILDRIDMHVEMQAVLVEKLIEQKRPSLASPSGICEIVSNARTRQVVRQGCTNAVCDDISSWESTSAAQKLLHRAVSARGYSVRVYNKLLRVARTIADMEGIDLIEDKHIAESLSLRALEKIANYIGLNTSRTERSATF